MNGSPKSATTAGILGIFLGGVGAHNWYLGQKKQGLIHAIMFGAGLLLIIIGAVIVPTILLSSWRALLTMAWLPSVLSGLGWAVIGGSEIWGLVEGIIILTKGDAGLAAQGYTTPTAVPAAPAAPVAPTTPASTDATTTPASATSDATGSAAPAAVATPQPVTVAPKPPKAPMDPAKKKKIIMFSCIGGGVLILGIAAAIILPAIFRVDYSTAYRKVKDLSSEISDIYYSYDCDHVEDYVSSTYTSEKTYEGYVEGCKNLGDAAKPLVKELGDTDGVKRNSEIKAQFDTFEAAFNNVVGNNDGRDKTLEKYSIWHKWVLASDKVDSWDQTDADLTAATNVLTNSGIDEFKTYAEGWLTRRKAAAAAYRAYWASNYSDPNRTELRNTMNNTQNEFKDWRSGNKPSTSDFGSLSSDGTSKMKSEFEKLKSLITDTYEKNYNEDSDDCYTFLGEVVCD